MSRLVVATRNSHKVSEIRSILAEQFPPTILEGIVPLSDFVAPDPVEDGITFAENALIKARSACDATGLPALADDSGIVVDVLGGAPGIFSARWCGYHGDDEKNRRLLLAQLVDVAFEHRGSAFVCVVALVTPGGDEFTAEGRVDGHLLTVERGGHGFGYDPIFVPEGYEQTTAEMTATQKNAVSHRGLALKQLVRPLREAFG